MVYHPGLNLILLERGEVNDSGTVTLRGGRADHLKNVLKVAPGHLVRVGVVDGPRGTGSVQSIARDGVELCCAFDAVVPGRPPVDLLLALPRPKVMRRLWAQIAALGVGRIVLTNAERVERNYFDTNVLTEDCYRPILIDGLQLARDPRMPDVSIHRQLKVLIEDRLDTLFPTGLRLLADPAAKTSAGSLVRKTAEERVLLAIGPEGGWNDFETALLRAHGFLSAGMGPRTLRSDTACVSLLALLHEALGRD
jgi:RsmE family RNA methyltransferase